MLDNLIKMFHTENTNLLKQGKLFQKNKNVYLKKNIIEGLGQREEVSDKTLSERRFNELKKKFNETLELYSKLYTTFLKHKMEDNTGLTYAGKIIKNRDSQQKWFVTNDGILKSFNKSRNELKDGDECPKNTSGTELKITTLPNQTIKDLLANSKTIKSNNKITGSMSQCWSGGHNIAYKNKNGEYNIAYLDGHGNKHIYKDAKFDNINISGIHLSCPKNLAPKYIIEKKEIWDTFPTGNSYGKNSTCLPLSGNNATETTLEMLNSMLISYSKQMNDLITSESRNKGSAYKRSSNWGKEVESKARILDSQKKELAKIKKQVLSLNESYNSTKKEVKSYNLQNTVWGGALLLLIVIIAIKIFKKK
tara:strand:+ start:704 stop:1795 length:1092 start_codon:yes stop_codon:yes gene_type:complete